MIQAFINGIEVVSDKDFTIKEEFLNTSSTILNNCYPKSWEEEKDYVNNFFFPKDYSSCQIYQNNNLIFAGIVKNSGEISLRPTDPKYCSLQILDYKTLLSEGQTLDFVISNKTIEEAINLVINAISSYGFVVGNIQLTNGSDLIGAYSTLNKTPYDVFQYLAEISQSKWFTRTIDENNVAIDFYSPELMEVADDIQYTQQYFEENNIVDIKFSFGTRDYRNKQTMLSDLVYANINSNENITTNGFQNAYTTSGIIGKIESIIINGQEKSFGTNTEKELGIYADFYYTPGTNALESTQNYTAGTIINVIYTPLVKGRQIVYNNNEINRISNQINRNGIIARYENRNDVLSSEELNKIGQAYIKYKGQAEILLTIITQNKDILKIGQQVYFDIPELVDLAQNYMVKTKETQITQTGDFGNIFYTYTLSSNFDSENAINYFDNQRRKSSGNITESEFITRNIDIENNANIDFENIQFTKEQIDSLNGLEAPLGATLLL